ncbi:arrestin domain-containing protein 17-like [Episyrphus balteatus]|uniref:arrestin domain-containing protein 17-like n=1 Tax=Episyrphus balteatus TaxID=286459 RepID=UPI002485A6C1|nr:arrestin domain-containing protein 17-like [Episyrphus balteatus]
MVVNCEIVFDQNPHGTYFAGQTVSGRVVLSTDKTKIIKGLALKIVGFARTKWTENNNSHNHTNDNKNTGTKSKSETYYGREDYFATTTYLLGSEESESIQIQQGLHNFTFACPLPPQCPSSFEGKYGHVRYVVKIVLVRPWKFDQTYSRAFTVLKLMDLNYDSPVLRVPAFQETFKTFCCGPCTSQPLKMKVFVPQTGYVPGEDIVATITVTNESTVPVIDLKISFVMLVTIFSDHPKMNSRMDQMKLVKIKGGVVNTKTTRTITQLIRVPATPPTCYNLCRLIKISYELEVEAKLKRLHQNPIVTIPITIGNVPIVAVINQQPLPSDYSRFQATAPPRSEVTSSIEERVFTMSGNMLPQPARNLSDPVSSGSHQIPPPSYEEAVFMTRADVNEEDRNALGKSEFVPRYPVYCCTEPCAPSEPETFSNNDPGKSTWL